MSLLNEMTQKATSKASLLARTSISHGAAMSVASIAISITMAKAK